MTQKIISASDKLRSALLTKIQGNDDELYALPAVSTLVDADVTYLQAIRAAVAVADLMDKSAIEAVSGAWNFTGQPKYGAANILTSAGVKIPPGIVIGWSGLLVNIPAGWTLCDGTAGTLDMRELFILATDDDEEAGALVGQDEYTLDVDHIPAHTHSVAGQSGGAHTHVYRNPKQISVNIFASGSAYANQTNIETGSQSNEDHAFTLDNAGEAAPTAVDNRPAFYEAAFIMKT